MLDIGETNVLSFGILEYSDIIDESIFVEVFSISLLEICVLNILSLGVLEFGISLLNFYSITISI